MKTTGFTLIELLIVIAIVSLLSAMLMPMYSIVSNSTRRSSTEFIIKKTEVALRQFKVDWSVYPCQTTYPTDPNADTGFPNRLYYHIGTDIDAASAGRVKADMVTAASKYVDGSGALQYTDADVLADTRSSAAFKFLLNRSAREQVRLGVLSGNLRMRGPIMTLYAGSTLSLRGNKSATLVIPSPTSSTGPGPGWACDYLHGEIEARFVRDQAILDAWGNQLVYICQVVPGVTTANALLPGIVLDNATPPRNYDIGLGPTGFELDGSTPGVVQTLVSQMRMRLLYSGRIRLDTVDAGDGLPVPTSTTDTNLPYTDNLMQSDMRYFCLRGYETDFELWSPGRDKRYSYIRSDPANRDNISVIPYNRGKP